LARGIVRPSAMGLAKLGILRPQGSPSKLSYSNAGVYCEILRMSSPRIPKPSQSHGFCPKHPAFAQ
jgi:hypothetical protein